MGRSAMRQRRAVRERHATIPCAATSTSGPSAPEKEEEAEGSNVMATAQATLELPRWLPEPQPVEPFVRHCHTQKCSDFQSGHCRLHKPMQCFNFHFEGQRRRPPIGADGYIRYWDMPCEWLAHPAKCPDGEGCQLAHSKDEISYHPAKYKTRMCNGKDCRRAICCFAHNERELRTAAPRHYSQAALAVAAGQQPASTAEEAGPFNLESFKVFPCRKGRGTPHDRKLCIFYHNLRDRRRLPGSYEAEPCNECFDAEVQHVGHCSRGDGCPKCHNRLELLYHRDVFRQRFCATFPNVASCQRGSYCAFAHSREEIGSELLPEEELLSEATGEFYMHRFKTLWCPYGIQHDWHQCVYAHTYQDWRRSPALGYCSEPCPAWSRNSALAEYEERCPKGFGCPLAHGSKEQLYHPLYYKTMPCTDWMATNQCPRGALCAFFHGVDERRIVPQMRAGADNSATLLDGEVLRSVQPLFRRPPLFALEGGELSCSRHWAPPGEAPAAAAAASVPASSSRTCPAPAPPPPVPGHPRGSRGAKSRNRGRARLARTAVAGAQADLHEEEELASAAYVRPDSIRGVSTEQGFAWPTRLSAAEAIRRPVAEEAVQGGTGSAASCSTDTGSLSVRTSLASTSFPSLQPLVTQEGFSPDTLKPLAKPRALGAQQLAAEQDEGSFFAFRFFSGNEGSLFDASHGEPARIRLQDAHPWSAMPSSGPAYIEFHEYGQQPPAPASLSQGTAELPTGIRRSVTAK